MRVSENSKIRRICISGALFLFYASLFCKWLHIVLNFRCFLLLVAKIPHRSAGFLPASFLSMQVGQRRQNRSPRQVFDSVFASKTNPTVMLSSKMCIYFWEIQMWIFEKGTHITHQSCGLLIFERKLFSQNNSAYIIHYPCQRHLFPQRLLPRSYRLPPD